MPNTAFYDKETGVRVMQYELVCNECPIKPTCDRNSVWCALAWATEPNEAQRALVETVKFKESKRRRQFHDAKQYQKNRDKKLAAANERNARLRAECPGAQTESVSA